MSRPRRLALVPAIFAAALLATAQTQVTIATVNNGDMIIMQRLSREFEKQNPDIRLNWVILEENVLRARVTTDIASRGSQFDILTIGTYETPIWGKRGWVTRLDEDLPADYDLGDVLKPVRDGLSFQGRLYALPFYGESSFTFYRKDLFDAVGLKMPEQRLLYISHFLKSRYSWNRHSLMTNLMNIMNGTLKW